MILSEWQRHNGQQFQLKNCFSNSENLPNGRYDLGTPLFLGWVGSGFHMTGGFFYLWSVCTPLCGGKET